MHFGTNRAVIELVDQNNFSRS